MRKFLHIHILLITTLIVSCLASCKKDDELLFRSDLDACDQTTIMYFMGTSLKYGYFDRFNIPDAFAAVSAGALGDNGRLLIFTQSYNDAVLYEVYNDNGISRKTTIATFKSNESLTQERMVEVIAKSKAFAPARSYNLIFSGHGSGWIPSNWTDLSNLRSIPSSTDFFEWEEDSPTRYMGCSIDGYMNVSELRNALDATNTKFGYLLFDMCFMSNIETLYELRDVCYNIIASPCEVMGSGFPYKTVLPKLFGDNGSTTDLDGACYAYYESYVNKELYDYPYAAVARCVTSELDDLADVVQRINASGINSVDIDNLQCYENLRKNAFCDLGDYITAACADPELFAEFKNVMAAAFPIYSRYHTDYFYSGLRYYSGVFPIDPDHYWGVSTSAPSNVLRTDWAQTSWKIATEAQ